jgi:hypothetical protein
MKTPRGESSDALLGCLFFFDSLKYVNRVKGMRD